MFDFLGRYYPAFLEGTAQRYHLDHRKHYRDFDRLAAGFDEDFRQQDSGDDFSRLYLDCSRNSFDDSGHADLLFVVKGLEHPADSYSWRKS